MQLRNAQPTSQQLDVTYAQDLLYSRLGKDFMDSATVVASVITPASGDNRGSKIRQLKIGGVLIRFPTPHDYSANKVQYSPHMSELIYLERDLGQMIAKIDKANGTPGALTQWLNQLLTLAP